MKVSLALAAAVALALPGAARPSDDAEPTAGRCTLDAQADDAPASVCLSCHQGGAGKAPRVDGHVGHATGIVYRSSASPEAPLRALRLVLARGIVLPEERITCVTCHAPGSPHPFKTRLPMETGTASQRLCNACHVMPGDEDRWALRLP